MLKRTWRMKAATLDDVCPEFDGWSDLYRSGDLVCVYDYIDEFCDEYGNTISLHPMWRDNFPWGKWDEAVSLLHESLRGLLLGREVPEGIYCLDFDELIDFRMKADRMLQTVRNGEIYAPEGVSVEAMANEVAAEFLTWDDHCEAETEGLPDFFDPILLAEYIKWETSDE